jgi:hypothetical protein
MVLVLVLVVEMVPADVVEMVPADVVEMVPADVVEIVPADVVEMVPPTANAVEVTAKVKSDAQRIDWRRFMINSPKK